MAEMDPVKLMKQEVGRAAAAQVQSDTIVGLGTGSTTAGRQRRLRFSFWAIASRPVI